MNKNVSDKEKVVMKKFYCIILVTMLLSGCVDYSVATTSTEDIDFSGYSYEELLDTEERLKLEMQSRDEAAAIILESGAESNDFLVGKHLTPGEYRVTLLEVTEPAWSRPGVRKFDSEYDSNNQYNGIETKMNEIGVIATVTLLTGNVFRITNCKVKIERIGNVVELDYEVPEGTTITPGIYLIGELIPAGPYIIYYNGVSSVEVITLRRSENTSSGREKGGSYSLNRQNTSVALSLEDGTFLEIEGGNVIVRKAKSYTFD